MLVVCLTGEASRSDATADFEVTLDCKPAGTIYILLIPVRDGHIGFNNLVIFTNHKTTATVTVSIGDEQELGLAVGWAPSIANRATVQGTVTFTT